MFCKIEFPPDGEKRNMKAFLLSPSDLGLAKGRKGEKREGNKLFNKKGLSFSQSKSAAATSCLRLRIPRAFSVSFRPSVALTSQHQPLFSLARAAHVASLRTTAPP